MVCSVGKFHTSAAQKFVERGPRQLGRKCDGGHVAAGAQGLCGRKGATERAVVVFGVIARKTVRGVGQQALGVDEPLFQRESVDHGFEGGTG